MRFNERQTTTARERDHRFVLSVLVLATGLVLTLQNPRAVESVEALFSSPQLPEPTQVFEMRPQGPPPAAEFDQLLMDEGEEAPIVFSRERSRDRPADLRAPAGL